MSWSSAVRRQPAAQKPDFFRPTFEVSKIDWAHLVVLDFETYFDKDYTLRKLSTSEYIRDPRFKAQMVGIKIGKRKTKVVPAAKIKAELKSIDWKTHDLLCHHTQFDGLILSHHYGIVPRRYYDTLSMARGLHSNDIGAGLDEVAQFYGKGNKIPDVLDQTKGVLDIPKDLFKQVAEYCAMDVELCLEIFKEMVVQMPQMEMDLIHHTVAMFCDPVLGVDLPRVEKELEREITEKRTLLLSTIGTPKQIERRLKGATMEDILEEARKGIASNENFANMLRAEGVEPPRKISPAYFKHKDESKKYAYAFAKTDLEFTALLEHPKKRVRELVEARMAVKSTTNETRAERFLKAGADGMKLPVYLRYAGAHTLRWSAGNSMNMQNLIRGGELRRSILAPKGHVIVVADSGQIEARVNAWISGQDDLLQDFADQKEGDEVDVYTKFASSVYGRIITKGDKEERFVGKVGILGLGYSMGPPKLQSTLAIGAMGPAVFFELDMCQKIVQAYRRKNDAIVRFWSLCGRIIEDMAMGRTGSYKCISWEKEKLWLPNGMALKYPGLKRVSNGTFEEWVYTRKGIPTKIYGGLLCENIVQALARIIIGEQLLEVAKKYRVVTTTHDELVALARAASGQRAYEFMHKVMSTPPAWCADLPLSCEGGFDVNYSK